MHFQDRLSAANVRQVDGDLPVKTPRTHQRRIEDVRTVGRRHDDDSVIGFKTVHLHEQLIERLLALVVSAAEPGAALAADRVDFVDKDDTGHIFLGGIKQIAHAGRAHADEHLHEIRSADREERNAGFPCDRLCEQRFSRSRRPHEEHPLGNARPQVGKLLGRFQELHNFL